MRARARAHTHTHTHTHTHPHTLQPLCRPSWGLVVPEVAPLPHGLFPQGSEGCCLDLTSHSSLCSCVSPRASSTFQNKARNFGLTIVCSSQVGLPRLSMLQAPQNLDPAHLVCVFSYQGAWPGGDGSVEQYFSWNSWPFIG